MNKKQISIYLGHGIAIKSMNSYQAPSNIDWFIGLSTKANEIMKSAFRCDISKFIITGYPRNDALLNKRNDLVNNIFQCKYNKIILWYPTYRQHTNSKVISASTNALPIIHDIKNAIKINDYAKDKNVLIILKPHFSQDIKPITKLNLTNLQIINDSFFTNHNISSYELVGGCDALITDYSSIYFDYLLCDKPVAAIWEDIKEYKNKRGFCVDIEFYMKGAYKIYNVYDFLHFIETVYENNDTLQKERKEINNLINYYQDNQSTKRVVDFIESIIQ